MTQGRRFQAGPEGRTSGILRSVWCRVMHDAPRWPIHGQYECGVCGAHYPVPWEEKAVPVNRARVLAPVRQVG